MKVPSVTWVTTTATIWAWELLRTPWFLDQFTPMLALPSRSFCVVSWVVSIETRDSTAARTWSSVWSQEVENEACTATDYFRRSGKSLYEISLHCKSVTMFWCYLLLQILLLPSHQKRGVEDKKTREQSLKDTMCHDSSNNNACTVVLATALSGVLSTRLQQCQKIFKWYQETSHDRAIVC